MEIVANFFSYVNMSFIMVMIIVISIDYLTGVLKAICLKKLNSTVGYIGIVKKCAIVLLLVAVYGIDVIAGSKGLLFNTVTIFYVINEVLSIIENLGAMGIPIPKIIIDTLDKLKDGGKNV